MTTGKKLLNLLLAPLILAAAILIVIVLVKSRKNPPPKQPVTAVPVVEIVESSAADVVPAISTFGNVRAYHQVDVAGQVGGRIEVIDPNFDPGRAVAAGDLLAKIEEADFRTVIAGRESDLAAIRQTVADEETRSHIAREDWLASGRRLEDAPDFTLRKPQLNAARAALEAAQAGLNQASLDLQRTSIRAPFDAIVQSREASPGNVIAAGAKLGSLIARDRAEVRLPLTPEQAARLDLPLAFVAGETRPLKAILRDPNRPGLAWEASVTRTEAGVDPRNQVLYVIAEIPAPFETPGSFLPVGAFVTAELSGRELEKVHRIAAAALVDDSFVWIVDSEDKLRRQPVERLFSGKGDFLARIAAPLAAPPLHVVSRPLGSFRDGGAVKIAPNATPVEP
ncbi:MAG: efflux RND transporter periplasmic adaptor subunit [Akkermansiaceae bacterium]